MPLGHEPQALWDAIARAELAHEPDEVLDGPRERLHQLEDTAAWETYWEGPGGWSRSVKGVWNPQTARARPNWSEWRPGLAETLLRTQISEPVATVKLPGKNWLRDLQPAMDAVENADTDVYWKKQFKDMNDHAAEEAKRIAAEKEGKDWSWSQGFWQFKKIVPAGGLDEDDPHKDLKIRQRALDASAMRAVADVARKAAEIADVRRLADANNFVDADGTMPPVGVTGWTTKVIDSPPHVFDSLILQDGEKAYMLANKIKEAAADYFPGGPFSRKRVGIEGMFRPSDIGNGTGPSGQYGRQGIVPQANLLSPPDPDPVEEPELNFQSVPLPPDVIAILAKYTVYRRLQPRETHCNERSVRESRHGGGSSVASKTCEPWRNRVGYYDLVDFL